MIPYGKQWIAQEDIDAVVRTLKSDFLTQGPAVPAFENAVAKKVDARFGVAVNSATSALHIAVKALGVGPGDRIWTSPITFVATANCARYCGADVDFVDIDPDTFNMSAAALERKLHEAELQGVLPKVILPVHMCGQSPEMGRISELATRYGIRVVEDASHAVGALYEGRPVGNCAYSDITVFSFHPVKIITSGEGGMAVTNDLRLADTMTSLRSHGITRAPDKMTGPSDGPWYYQQLTLGYNYRLTDIQAALGLSQLERLETAVGRRHELAERYDSALEKLPIALPVRRRNTYSAFHLYVIRLKDATKAFHRNVYEFMRDNAIGVNLHYIPVHLQPYYETLGFRYGDFPEAERYYGEAITLPLFPLMSEADQDEVVRVLTEALKNCAR